MSEMEHNKGKLIPFNLTEEIAKALVEGKGEDLCYYTYLEQVNDDLTWYDTDLVRINGIYYKVRFHRTGPIFQFVDVSANEDGSIDFNTYHYNGGAHWTEVVERALK